MGTSSDRTAGTGGNWTPLKTAATTYVKGLGAEGSRQRAQRVLLRHIPILGGAAGAVASARAGTSTARRLGAVLAGVGRSDLASTLEAIGLGNLVGQDRFTVVDELITYIAGAGDDLDAQAARDAACDILEELFGDADSWDELALLQVDAEQLGQILERFIAAYIYNRIPVVAERLSSRVDPAAMRAADQEMRQIIEGFVALHLADAFELDWAGDEGRIAVESAMRDAYETIASLGS